MKRWQELESAVVQLLTVCRLRYWRVKNYRCFRCGQVQNSEAKNYPDFFIPEFHLFIECKTGSGQLTTGQKSTISELEKYGYQVIILKDNVDKFLQFLKKKGYIITP